MNGKKTYISFQTDEVTAYTLKMIAHELRITQTELLNQICKEFIEELDEIAKKELQKLGYNERGELLEKHPCHPEK